MKSSRDEAPPITLTAEQEALFGTVSAAVEDAASAALHEHGALLCDLTADEVRSLALVGGKEAIASHQPEKGPLRTWVFFKALYAVLDHARGEHRRTAKVVAMVRASAVVYWSRYGETVEIGVDDEATLHAKLQSAGNGFYAHAALKMAAAEPPVSDTEEDVGLRQAAAWAGNTLRRAVGGLEPADQALLQKHFGENKPLTEIATEMGVPQWKYRTFVRDFHALVAGLGGSLLALGMNEMPPWVPEISGTVLGSEG